MYKIRFFNKHFSIETYDLENGKKMTKKLKRTFGAKNIKLIKVL